MNSEIEIKLRRHKNNLTIGGKGFIVFGVWSILKVIMTLTMTEETISALLIEADVTEDEMGLAMVFMVIALVILGIQIMGFHFVIGTSAIKYAKAMKNRVRFYICTVIVTAVNISGFSIYPVSFANGLMDLNESVIASVLVDTTVVFLLVNLLYSAINIEILTRHQQKEKEES